MKLWESEEGERLLYFPAKKRVTDGSVVIFPGGAYAFLAQHEGQGYARFLSENGVDAFVCLYRVAPHRFPLPLLDARRAVRRVRAAARSLLLNPEKIAVMGSSAGGNLAALLCTHKAPLPGEGVDEVDALPFMPQMQILCYPVITLCDNAYTHPDSRSNLFGGDLALAAALSPEKNVCASTPPAFLWHTADDPAVPCENTLVYAASLHQAGVPVQAHLFEHGYHGMGLAEDDPVVGLWKREMLSALLRRFDRIPE